MQSNLGALTASRYHDEGGAKRADRPMRTEVAAYGLKTKLRNTNSNPRDMPPNFGPSIALPANAGLEPEEVCVSVCVLCFVLCV
jgi:hypothetical protein